ncbi:MAG: hypothetical protein F6K11_19390 [Leptolyngbya sp. SIO3F4]|nr:hypothetical protein [Leptolyngbya sp. SIO3F4]
MKRLSVNTWRLVNPVVVGAAMSLGIVSPTEAQTIPASAIPPIIDQASLAQLTAALSYPNSSQRFFEVGRAEMEREIYLLLDEDIQSEPLLTVQPEVLKQFED